MELLTFNLIDNTPTPVKVVRTNCLKVIDTLKYIEPLKTSTGYYLILYLGFLKLLK